MQTFEVCTRSSLVVKMAMTLAFGAIPMTLLITREGGLLSFILGVGAILGALFVLRSVHTIRVERNGKVHFERLLSTICVNVRDIAVLEGFRKQEYDDMVWNMRVHYRGGEVTLPFFVGAEEFAASVRALEPRVRVRGEWPTLDPWGTTA